MSMLTAYIKGIGLLGPGLDGWHNARALLAATAAGSYVHAATILPSPASLPPAERRRCGPLVKLTLAAGHAAVEAAQADASSLPLVFAASGGDGLNCHEICAMLASDDRQISPTRFHNSVHNAAAGYWSIATGAMTPSSVLCAHDGSFAAGLLDSLTQLTVEQRDILLIVCDTPYPSPLGDVRTIAAEFGIALVLSPVQSALSLARIDVRLDHTPASRMELPALESLRTAVPAARCLPLLAVLAALETGASPAGRVSIDYLQDLQLGVEVSPCR